MPECRHSLEYWQGERTASCVYCGKRFEILLRTKVGER